MIEVFTDGGCIENPGGIGAWAFVVVDENGQAIHEDSGADPETTNNRMELEAVIRAFEYLGDRQAIVRTDSDLTVKCGNKLWKRRSNLDLWDRFFKARHALHALAWLKGHNGNRWNERADDLCSIRMEELRLKREGYTLG